MLAPLPPCQLAFDLSENRHVTKIRLPYREHTILRRPLKPEEVQHFTETARRIGAILLMTGTEH